MSTEISDKKFFEIIPSRAQSTEAFYFIVKTGEIKSGRISIIKKLAGFNDAFISQFLNVNVKTYRSYLSNQKRISKPLQEHVVMFLSLLKHGKEYFGDSEKFKAWLNTENFYLDWKQPSEYLDTINGIVVIDTMLTNMEQGNNA